MIILDHLFKLFYHLVHGGASVLDRNRHQSFGGMYVQMSWGYKIRGKCFHKGGSKDAIIIFDLGLDSLIARFFKIAGSFIGRHSKKS